MRLDLNSSNHSQVSYQSAEQPMEVNRARPVFRCYDWLHRNGVRLYFDLGCIRVHQTYIPLQEFMHISFVVRVHSKTKIKQQTAVVCKCEVRNSPDLSISGIYQVSPPKVGFFNYEPGLMAANSVAKLTGNRIIPVMVVKHTNKTFQIKKGQ